MKITVIIPVYNAEQFLIQAVESALLQPQTDEIILVEDASPDNALEVCKSLEQKYDKVRLLRHSDKKNHGAGASRNLGLKNAKNDFIAFLDADDFFLKNRFSKTCEIFEQDSSIEGVYEALGVFFQNEKAKKRWNALTNFSTLTTINKKIVPDHLLEMFLFAGVGHFSLDALVFKKSVLIKTGFFNENLMLGEDTEWIIKLISTSKLVPGIIDKAVAMRRFHDNNRVDRSKEASLKYKKMYEKSIFNWSLSNKNLNKENKQMLSYWYLKLNLPDMLLKRIFKFYYNLFLLFFVLYHNPSFITSPLFFRFVTGMFSRKLERIIFGALV